MKDNYKFSTLASAVFLFAVGALISLPTFGAYEIMFTGNGKSGSLTNELNYGASVRQYVTNPTPDNH